MRCFQILDVQVMENKMYNQQSQRRVSRSRYRNILMAGIAVSIIVVAAIIIIAVSGASHKTKDNGCLDGLECLPLSECEGHRNLDFTYACGDDHICCLSKIDNFTDVSSETRMTKLALLPKKCGLTPGKDRIANGVNATLGEFPWMALLGYTSPRIPILQYSCGGTIINNRYILTAAHCTTDTSTTLHSVILGELNLVTKIDCEIDAGTEVCADAPVIIRVGKIIPHPKFNSTSLRHDIALLRLEQEIPKFTDFIQPICLPFNVKIDENYLKNKSLTISGWGKTSASSFSVTTVLQQARVNTWNLDKCNDALPPRVKPINTRQVCATGEDLQEACRGDSGGPLIDFFVVPPDIKYTQIGIVSFKSLNTCGTEDVPTVFTRVDKYLDWILDNIAK